VNTVLDLNGDLAGGLYMVNITAGDKTYTERLVIQGRTMRQPFTI
jgi:hypothetical protein